MEPSIYESEKCGLICGYLFSPESGAKSITATEALEWLNNQQTEYPLSFIWLHFNLAQASTEKWMRDHLALQDAFFELLSDGSRSTRIEYSAENVFAVINDVAFRFSFEPSEMSTLWMNVNQRAVITARTHPSRSIDQLRVAVKNGETFSSPMGLMIHLMHDQGEVLTQIAREATLKVDEIEDNLLVGSLQHKRSDLGKLRRVLVRLQRLLAPEPAALFRFLHQPPSWIAETDLVELRQSTEEFSLVIIDLAALQERIKLLQEEMAAQVSEQTNRSLFTLTIVTVLALPINIIAGLLGMNVGGIPLAQSPHGFSTVVVIVVTFTGIAGWFAFRKKKD
ncbi:MAG: transporter [Methylophilales bacterium]|nr:transporter [Methylophilales bacterium]